MTLLWLTAFLVAVIVIGMVGIPDTDIQHGGMSKPFSGIEEDMGHGVPGSYSGQPNGPDPTKQQYHAPKGKLVPTYYGHGIPLKDNDRFPGPFEGPRLTSHHFNPKCAPECCPSPYSCDRGCLCVDTKGLGWKAHEPVKPVDPVDPTKLTGQAQ